MKYLKSFETLLEYNGYTLDSNNTPNVSLIKELLQSGNRSIRMTAKITAPTPPPPHDY